MDTAMRTLTTRLPAAAALLMPLFLSGIFTPRFGLALSGDRLVDQTRAVADSFLFARSEARRLGQNVAISALDPSQPADWRRGWVIWVDHDQDGALGTGEDLRVVKALTETASLTSLSGLSAFTYSASGLVDRADEFDLCDGAPTGYRISVSATGNLLVTEYACG